VGHPGGKGESQDHYFCNKKVGVPHSTLAAPNANIFNHLAADTIAQYGIVITVEKSVLQLN
jgi:hypothetical protein